MDVIIFAGIAYLIGSISTAVLVCKFMGLPNPTTEGSKNPGATNVLRVGGKNAAIIVLAADAAKGFISVLIAKIFAVSGFGLGLVAAAAVVGHIFPLFSGFKGGKGVATALGGILGLSIIVGFISAIIWAGVAFITKYASLASLVALALAPVFMLFISNSAYFIPVAVITALVAWRHMGNIERLRSGTESKLEF